MNRRILFVDDDEHLLMGLRRMLRHQRAEWDMQFCQGGEEALRILAADPFDVIISDMRMPGMDGAELLTRVRAEHPEMVRIVLSGHTDQEMVMRSVGPAHQYLCKPADSETIVSVIKRACNVRDMLTEQSLLALVSRMDTVPSLPDLYHQITREVSSPEGSIHSVGEIIRKDLGMTAKVLQIVNSSFFGLRRSVSDPAQAVGLLGMELVRSLVLSVHVFSEFDCHRLPGFSPEALWSHGMTVAVASRNIALAQVGKGTLAEDAFLAGMLHDIGKLLMAVNLPDQYGEVLRALQADQRPDWEIEHELIGHTHAQVGGYLVGLWGLPESVVNAIALHHQPSQCPDHSFSSLTAVHVADALCARVLHPDAPPTLDEVYLAGMNLTDQIPDWTQICAETCDSQSEEKEAIRQQA